MHNDNQKPQRQPQIFYTRKTRSNRYPASTFPQSRSTYAVQEDKSNQIETFQPKTRSSNGRLSPWQRRMRRYEQTPTHDNKSKAPLNQLQLQRQKEHEMLVYGENSCRAVFKQRPDAIIKVFISYAMTVKFRQLLIWLAEHNLGYDVVDDARLEGMVATPHHGGIVMIVKKRQAQSVTDYLHQHAAATQDLILALDDIANPHNIGGIIRSAAFYNVSAVLLRQSQQLDTGAALRVSEGGAEFVLPLACEDMVLALDQLQRSGYQVVMLLPYQIPDVNAKALSTVQFKNKTVLVLSQQFNPSLAQCVDEIVYLPANDAMPALNISVAAGVLLAQWQQAVSNLSK